MPELLLAAAIALFLGGGAALVGWLAWQTLLTLGLVLLGLGTLGSFPSSVLYHVRLHRSLAPRGALPRRWWLSPIRLHERLDPAGRAAVLPWFYVGAASFVLAVLGGVLALAGILRAD